MSYWVVRFVKMSPFVRFDSRVEKMVTISAHYTLPLWFLQQVGFYEVELPAARPIGFEFKVIPLLTKGAPLL